MIVFVTGATSGFGAAIARRFAAEGHHIIAAGRRLDRLEALRQECGADRIHPLRLEPAQRADPDAWEQMVDTNVKGVMYVTRAVLPGMVERRRGHVINLGSIAGTYAYPGGNVYGATKAFVRQFSLGLRADLFGTPIRVTSVEPGLVGGTEFSAVRFGGDATKASKIYDGADALTPEDVAEAVHWVASLPARVNINAIEMMPVTQSFGPLPVHRTVSG